VSPLRGEKPQNRPLSKRNTGRFALRAMLPVTSLLLEYSQQPYSRIRQLVDWTSRGLVNLRSRQLAD